MDQFHPSSKDEKKRKRKRNRVKNVGQLGSPIIDETHEEEGNREKPKGSNLKGKKKKDITEKEEFVRKQDDLQNHSGTQEEEKEENNGEEAEKQKKKVKSTGIMSTESFASLGLSEPTLKAIQEMGFEHMTQVNFLFLFILI